MCAMSCPHREELRGPLTVTIYSTPRIQIGSLNHLPLRRVCTSVLMMRRQDTLMERR